MTACFYSGCGKPATLQVFAKIWALATRPSQRNDGNCASVITSVVVCGEHREALNAEEMFGQLEGRARLRQAFAATGMSEPDLDGIKIAFQPIVGDPVDPMEEARRSGNVVIS